METVRLVRFDGSDQGTFGKIYYPDHIRFTGELPDRNNQNNISCIPKGIYKVLWTLSPRLKKFTYEVQGVPKRGGIRIHSSNLMGDSSLGYVAQLLGCISIGEQLGYIKKQKALLISKPAVDNFILIMQKLPFMLEISDAN
jgi:hypothetical protein